MPKKSPDPTREDRAWEVLQELHRQVPQAVLIGGWATYLHLRGQKSHDIDLIVDMPAMAVLQSRYQLEPRGHLAGRKYKATIRDVGVDVYAAHQSELGQRLRLPVEALLPHSRIVAGHRTLAPEALFVAKMAALLDRPDTLPGNKDRAEMWGLIRHRPAEWRSEMVAAIVGETRSAPATQRQLVSDAFDYLGEVAGLTRADKQTLKAVRDSVDSAMQRNPEARTRADSELQR